MKIEEEHTEKNPPSALNKREFLPELWKTKPEQKDNLKNMMTTSQESVRLTQLINGKNNPDVKGQLLNFQPRKLGLLGAEIGDLDEDPRELEHRFNQTFRDEDFSIEPAPQSSNPNSYYSDTDSYALKVLVSHKP